MACMAARSGRTRTTLDPDAASAAACRPGLGMWRMPAGAGAMITTWSYPAARSALASERTPPSMKRRPPMVTGGQIPGTAQLAPTASTSPASPAESNTMNSPVCASTAVTSRGRAGQSLVGSRASNTLRRSASGMVRAASAQRPSRARPRTGSALVLMTHSSLATLPQPMRAAGSGSGGASCARYSASGSWPDAMSAPTTEPADVPTIRSAAARSMPRSASPAIRPVSQAMPVTPPPPRTSARLPMTYFCPNPEPGGGGMTENSRNLAARGPVVVRRRGVHPDVAVRQIAAVLVLIAAGPVDVQPPDVAACRRSGRPAVTYRPSPAGRFTTVPPPGVGSSAAAWHSWEKVHLLLAGSISVIWESTLGLAAALHAGLRRPYVSGAPNERPVPGISVPFTRSLPPVQPRQR